jgi:hypothetical protein
LEERIGKAADSCISPYIYIYILVFVKWHGRREDTKEDTGDEAEWKKTKRQAKNQVDGPSNERCRKEGEEMDAGETRQGMGR